MSCILADAEIAEVSLQRAASSSRSIQRSLSVGEVNLNIISLQYTNWEKIGSEHPIITFVTFEISADSCSPDDKWTDGSTLHNKPRSCLDQAMS